MELHEHLKYLDERRNDISTVSAFKHKSKSKVKPKTGHIRGKLHREKSKTESIKSDTVDLYSLSKKKVIQVPLNDVMKNIYYLEVRPATPSELAESKSKFSFEDVKEIISSQDTDIPLYDVFTSNIYLIQRRNVYHRVINNHYRFPDSILLDMIRDNKNKLEAKFKSKPEKYSQDLLFQKKLRKARLMVEFMSYFDMIILFNTYLRVFYLYAPEISNQTYTCLRKSFIPHKGHLLPYYTRDEVIRLAMNNELIEIPRNKTYDDFRDSMSDSDFEALCVKIQTNDISSAILLEHQNYIIKNNSVGLIQYYTIQGSFFVNQYMRQQTRYEYRNDYLENIIDKMWRLVLNSPAFDNDYILYRFVSNDSYLATLEVGDVFVDPGFTSTTRDPFYRTDLYQFGFILIKIRIPKGVKGVGLCIETLSHFPNEEEIILAPMSRLRLIAKTDASDYYHPDKNFVAEVKKGYEFEFITSVDIDLSDPESKLPFPKRAEYTQETNIVDFINIDKPKTLSLRERISGLMNTQFDPMNRIRCKIGDNIFYVVGEYYNSTGAYEPMYAITTSEGFSLYSIYNGYILFMIEIGEIDGSRQIRVNYFTKYSELKREDIMGDDNFISFISSIAYYFDVPNVIIYADYHSCDHLEAIDMRGIKDVKDVDIKDVDVKNIDLKGGSKQNPSKIFELKSIELKVMDALRRQKLSLKNMNNISGKIIINPKQVGGIAQRAFQTDSLGKAEKNITNDIPVTLVEGTDSKIEIPPEKIFEQEDVEYTGGSYCLDFYRYLKYGTRRYEDTNTLNIELRPKFDYRDLDVMKSISPSKILSAKDRDELYQIYRRAYLLKIPEDTANLADFYIWMIENKCYLMDIFVAKLNRLYKDRNPFKKDYYILDSITYLYNRDYIKSYSRYIRMDVDEEHQLLVIPKNDYRIARDRDLL